MRALEPTPPTALAVPPPPPPRRKRAKSKNELFGPFLVFESIGDGGMATVHRAEYVGPKAVQRTVALKRMLPQLAEDPEFVAAFKQEGELAKTLLHDNIARTYEAGRVGNHLYIAMEYIPGATLMQIMAQSRSAAGAIPLHVVVQILIQLCDALDYAHQRSVIHRDVAPANVIVSSTGVVKLIDFGVAKSRGSRATQVGMIKGKLSYVAPEYTFGILDRRADLFSLGVVAYEMITGQRLLLGETPFDTITNVREKPIQPPSRYEPKVSRDLDDIVLTAVQRDPAKRWQSAAAMRVALANVARTLPRCGATELRTWVEWAFSQRPRPDHSIVRVLGELEQSAMARLGSPPPSAEDKTSVEKPAKRALPPRPAKPVAPVVVKEQRPLLPPRPPQPTERLPPPPRPRGGSAWYLVLAAMLAGSGVAAALLL